MLIDTDAGIKAANAAAAALFGRSTTTLLTQTLYELSPLGLGSRDGLKLLLQDIVQRQEGTAAQVLWLETGRGNHPLPWLRLALSAWREMPNCILAECVALPARGESNDQPHSGSDLLRNLAHEIKNPLGGIRGAAQLLSLEIEDAQLRDYTRIIVAETDRLNDLLDRMLLPQRRLIRREPIAVQALYEHVRALVLAQFGDALRIDVSNSRVDWPLRADPGQLLQVLLNLVLNAAQALKEAQVPNARILLETSALPAAELVKQGWTAGLALTVIDNGPGIAPSLQGRLFEPKSSGRPGGCGLGLSLAHRLASLHGGSITVASQPGRTVFSLLLPLDE